MNRKNNTADFDMPQMLLDNLMVCFAYILSCLIYEYINHSNLFKSHFWMFIIFAVIFTLTMSMTHMYNVTTFYYTYRIITKTLIATIVAGMSQSTAFFLFDSVTFSRLLFVSFCLFAFVSALLARLIKRTLRSAEIGNGYTHVIFIGCDEIFKRYQEYISNTALKIKVDKQIDIADPVLHEPETLRNLLIHYSVSEIILDSNLEEPKNERIREILKLCEELGTTVRVIMDVYETPNLNRFVSSIGPLPVVTYHTVPFDKLQLFIKSIIDVIFAAIGLVVVSPIMLVTAICIKLESRGPVLFKQKRAGRNGKVFEIYKFRSMYTDAEERKAELMARNKIKDGRMFKIDDDPRVTKVGSFIRKSSIDELPQLINVLKRDMSLVGTRPPTLDEVEKYEPWHWRRISIMPGITGMWQVSGRSSIVDFEEVVSLDKKYIDNWSIGLDILILMRTVRVLITKCGAS